MAEAMNTLGRDRSDRLLGWIERILMVVGAACLFWAGTSSLSAIAYQYQEKVSLERGLPDRTNADDPQHSATVGRSQSLGRLEVPRLGLSVVVAEGDDDTTLAAAAGHLPDTPLPWEDGNTAVAGHRDTFFRPLQRIQVGDEIRFATRQGTFRYRVTRQTVVNPDDVWVLDPAPSAALTLITCYPFDFVGPAPQRFIVHAERLGGASGDTQASTNGGNPR
jgi:sortase A